MKAVKGQSRLVVRSPERSVSLHVGDCKVTIKVRTPLPQTRPQAMLRWHQ